MVRVKNFQVSMRSPYGVFVVLCILLSACSTPRTVGVVATSDASGHSTPQTDGRYETKQVNVPSVVTGLLQGAEQDIAQGQFELAKNKLSRAQRISPSYSRTYLLWSKLYLQEGQADKAEQMLNRASSLATTTEEKRAVRNLKEKHSTWH